MIIDVKCLSYTIRSVGISREPDIRARLGRTGRTLWAKPDIHMGVPALLSLVSVFWIGLRWSKKQGDFKAVQDQLEIYIRMLCTHPLLLCTQADREAMPASEQLHLRLTPEQLADIREKAKLAGVTVTTYVLQRVLAQEAPIEVKPKSKSKVTTKPVEQPAIAEVLANNDLGNPQQLVGPSSAPEPETVERQKKKLTWEQMQLARKYAKQRAEGG